MFNFSRKSAAVVPFIAVAAMVMTALAVFGTGGKVDAQEPRSISDGLTLVAFDTSLTQIEDIEAAQLAANLVVTNADRGLIFVGRYSEYAEDPQEYSSVDEAKSAINDIAEQLMAKLDGTPVSANMSEMLENYSSSIQQIDGLGAGRMFVISAGRFTFRESGGVDGLAVLAGDLAAGGVVVNTISLATTPSTDRDVLAVISAATGGTAYDIGFLDGVIEFINSELNVQLTPSLETQATSDIEQTLNIEVPPHSSYLVAGFAFEDPDTNNVIQQPNGQVIASTVGSVSEFSIANMKFYTVRNPQPGVWILRSAKGSGSLKLFSDLVNHLSVDMPLEAPYQAGEQFVITANALSGEQPLIDASAMIDAVVTGPDGAQLSYVLNDLGRNGDVFSEDGTFTATVAPQDVVGISDVQLSMRWPNLPATIAGSGAFAIEPFPTIEITTVALGNAVDEGVSTHLATVDLKIGEFPFLADQEHVEVSVTDVADGSAVDFELEPAEIVDGKIYQLRILAALTMPGDYEFDATLRSTHLERGFEAVAAKQSQSVEIAVPTPIVIYAAIGVGAFFGFVVLLMLIRAMFQSRPFGYLYRLTSNRERELVADFAKFRRSPWDSLVNKPVIPAAALPGVPLLGGRFVFSSRGLAFRYRPDSDGLLRMTVQGEALQNGITRIADNEEFVIGSDTFVFDRAQMGGDVRVSERMRSAQRERNAELQNFALDPMTWDAPSSARPTRRRY